jgi:DNA-binding NarL/FixJ family response regulator
MRILVVSPDPLARRAMADLVGRVPDAEVVGAVDPGAAPAFEGARSPPEVVLWESTAEPGDLRRLSDLCRAGQLVIALVTNSEQARRVRAAGAAAVLPRGVDAPALGAAMAAVFEGLVISDPSLEPPSGELLDVDEMEERLTPRELEVLGLIAEGLPNKAIAARLSIRESTVKDHVNSLLDKLGAHSRTEAVTLALRRGLIAI